MTQVADYVRMGLMLQLIKGILRGLRKLLKYFNGTANSTPLELTSSRYFSVIFNLDLNVQNLLK